MTLQNDDDPDLQAALSRVNQPPEIPVDAMWEHIERARVAPPALRARWRSLGLIAAAVVGVVWLGLTMRNDVVTPDVDTRRAQLEAGLSQLPDTTAAAVRAGLVELDTAINDLDQLLRSDPSTPAVIDLRTRFDRQRDALIERALEDVRSSGT